MWRTVFWPTSLKGLEWVGWRDTIVFFALLQLAVCLPLHLAFVPRGASATAPAKAGASHGEGTLPARSRRIAFVGLACAFALNGDCFLEHLVGSTGRVDYCVAIRLSGSESEIALANAAKESEVFGLESPFVHRRCCVARSRTRESRFFRQIEDQRQIGM